MLSVTITTTPAAPKVLQAGDLSFDRDTTTRRELSARDLSDLIAYSRTPDGLAFIGSIRVSEPT